MKSGLSFSRPDSTGNRAILYGALFLCALLAVPVAGVLILQGSVARTCATQEVAAGVAEGRLAWRITRMACKEGGLPFYDVSVGAVDKTLSTALTSRGAPVPIGVVRLDPARIGVRLDRSWPPTEAGQDVIPVRLRKSGSPVERIDLQARSATLPAIKPD